MNQLCKEKTVLVISNDREQFLPLTKILQGAGYEVRFEIDTDASLLSPGAPPPQLIISELAVHGLDGLHLCRQVRKTPALKHTPVVLVGDLAKRSPIVADSFLCGATQYVQRPIDELEFAGLCTNILRAKDTLCDSGASRSCELVVEDVPEVVMTIRHTDGTILSVSPSVQHLLGYDPLQLSGRRLLDLIHPADIRDTTEYLNSIQWTLTDFPMEHRMRLQDGTWKLFRSKARNAGDPDLGWTTVITTREIQAHEFTLSHLLGDDSLIQLILDNAAMGLALFSAGGHLMDCNDRLLQMLDPSKSQLLNMALSEFVFSHDLEKDKMALSEIFTGHRDSYEFNNGYLTSEGRRVWAPLKIVAVPAAFRRPEVLVGIFANPEGTFSGADNGQMCPGTNGMANILDLRRWAIDQQLMNGN